MNRKVDVNIWDRYWRLTIVKEEEIYKGKYRKFKCKCDCWNTKVTLMNNLRRWKIKSCGCIVRENNINRQKTHWLNWSRIHRIYYNMVARCRNPKNNRYYCYGGRWINCRWNSFEEFYNDMSSAYSDNLQIDRIDVNDDYYKDNCRWVDIKTQARNRRNNVYYKWKTISELREEYNMTKWKFDHLRYKKKLELSEIFT